MYVYIPAEKWYNTFVNVVVLVHITFVQACPLTLQRQGAFFIV